MNFKLMRRNPWFTLIAIIFALVFIFFPLVVGGVVVIGWLYEKYTEGKEKPESTKTYNSSYKKKDSSIIKRN